METGILITLIAGAVSTGIVGSSLTQITKKHIPDKWRTIFALSVTAAVSLLGSGIVWALGGTWTWEAMLTQILASLGVAQATYALIKPAIPGSQNVDIDSLIQQVKDLTATMAKLTANTPTDKATTNEKAALETEQNTATS